MHAVQLCVVTRTGSRPFLFSRLRASLMRQRHVNELWRHVVVVDEPSAAYAHTLSDADVLRVPKGRKTAEHTCPYNAHLSVAMDHVYERYPSSWVVILDDDAVVMSRVWMSTLLDACARARPDPAILQKVRLHGAGWPIRSDGARAPYRVDMANLVLRASDALHLPRTTKCGGDKLWFKHLCERHGGRVHVLAVRGVVANKLGAMGGSTEDYFLRHRDSVAAGLAWVFLVFALLAALPTVPPALTPASRAAVGTHSFA